MRTRLILPGCVSSTLAALAIAGALLLTGGPAYAVTYTVNSTADTDDATCDVADCTLREAINAANASGGLDLIDFDPAVFPAAAPATIALASELPDVTDPVTIDGTGAGVVVEPAAGTAVQYGFFVRDNDTGVDTDFSLINLTVRGFVDDAGDGANPEDGDAVYVCGDDGTPACGTDAVAGVNITDSRLYANDNDGLDIDADGVDDVNITDSDIFATGGDGVNACCGTDVDVSGSIIEAVDTAVYVSGGGDSTIDVSDNARISGGMRGVYVQHCLAADLSCTSGTSLDVYVERNDAVNGYGLQAVEVESCESTTCTGVSHTVRVVDNGDVFGGDTAVKADICDTTDCSGAIASHTLTVRGNDEVVGDRYGVDAYICTFGSNCDDAPVSVEASGHELLQGGDYEAVRAYLCYSSSSCERTSNTLRVDSNTLVQGGTGDDAVEGRICYSTTGCERRSNMVSMSDNGQVLGNYRIAQIYACNSDSPCDGATQSFLVNRNDELRAGADDGVDLELCYDCATVDIGGTVYQSMVIIEINDNGYFQGGNSDTMGELDLCDGGSTYSCSGYDDGSTVTQSIIRLDVLRNGELFSDYRGFDVDMCYSVCNDAQVTATLANNGDFFSGEDDAWEVEQCLNGCHDSTVRISVNDNGRIYGSDYDALINIEQCRGGSLPNGCDRSTVTFETLRNEELTGWYDVFEHDQCDRCQMSTITTDISNNGPIHALYDDFIEPDLCAFDSAGACDGSTILFRISDNGVLLSGDDEIVDGYICYGSSTCNTIVVSDTVYQASVTVEVSRNERLEAGGGGDEVFDIAICASSAGCSGVVHNSVTTYTPLVFDVSDNGLIEGAYRGIDLEMCAFGGPPNGCDYTDIDVTINRNAGLNAVSDDTFEVDLCDGKSCADSMIDFWVQDNLYLIAGEYSDVFEFDLCLSESCARSVVNTQVLNNGVLTGGYTSFDVNLCTYGSVDCQGIDLTFNVNGHDEMTGRDDEFIDLEVCSYDANCSSIAGSPQYDSVIDIDFTDNGPLTGGSYDSGAELDLCQGTATVCDGIDQNNPLVLDFLLSDAPSGLGAYDFTQLRLCNGDASCDYGSYRTEFSFLGDLKGLEDEGFDAEMCSFGATTCMNSTVDFIVQDNGDITGGVSDQALEIDACRSTAGCSDVIVTSSILRNGDLRGNEEAILYNSDSFETTLIVNDNEDITGAEGNGIDVLGLATGEIMRNGTISGQGANGTANSGIRLGDVAVPGSVIDSFEIAFNAIAGSAGRGVDLQDEVTGTDIHDNTIERNAGAGVAMTGTTAAQMTGNDVHDNVIRDNGGAGVLVALGAGNTIGPANTITGNGTGGTGVVVTGADSDQNFISGNDFDANVGLGIDLNDDGVTANDGGDPDMGPNDEQNFPDNLALAGNEVQGDTCPFCLVQVYGISTHPDASGHGEGAFLGLVSADGSGNFAFDIVAAGCQGVTHASTTATSFSPSFNTSEFSDNLDVSSVCGGATASPTVTSTVSGRATRTPVGGTFTPTPTPTTPPSGTPTATPTPTPSPTPGPTGRVTRTPGM